MSSRGAGSGAAAQHREPPWWRRLGRREPVVLLYHGFADAPRPDDPEHLFVPLPELDAQLAWLRREGWALLTWGEYEAIRRGRAPRPRRSVLLTIDDAYDSTRAGLAVMARHEAPCVLYTPAGLIGETAEWLPEPEDEPLLTADELKELAGPLVAMGVHGWDHSPMRGGGADYLAQQTAEARNRLEEVVGPTVPSFAYPFGIHDAAARRAVAEAGYDSAFSVFDDKGTFAISRVDVNATDSLASFRLKLMPGYRRVWRLLDRASFLRRGTRRLLTRDTTTR
ncbi:polysaccharide deacetylase family protein [Nocardioidaceae bacterium]|nr:polysaccharide deacetylase family protein [Nocardioidaceae bacterium]